MKRFRLWFTGIVLPVTTGCLLGCTMTLTGGGELSVGMRNDNFLTLRHTVDGDKEGKEAKSDLDVDPAVMTIFGAEGPEPETP